MNEPRLGIRVSERAARQTLKSETEGWREAQVKAVDPNPEDTCKRRGREGPLAVKHQTIHGGPKSRLSRAREMGCSTPSTLALRGCPTGSAVPSASAGACMTRGPGMTART